jgi:hypothetical protein
MVLACAVSLFLGCAQGGGDPNYGGEVRELGVSATTADGVKYYSLSTGEEVTGDDINTDKWDIAFSRTRLILTNSGDTAAALNSGGKGAVWYTDKTVLSEVVFGDQVVNPEGDFAVLAQYTTDQKRYIQGMGGSASELTLNIMSYTGYRNELEKDGKSSAASLGIKDGEDASSTMPNTYDKKQYYKSSGMVAGAPTWPSTEEVYIIRHGNGANYSKIQIEYQYTAANTTASPPTSAADTWGITYQNF